MWDSENRVGAVYQRVNEYPTCKLCAQFSNFMLTFQPTISFLSKYHMKPKLMNVLFEYWTVFVLDKSFISNFPTESVTQLKKFGKHCYSPRQNVPLTSHN